jgi:hypothetical protein
MSNSLAKTILLSKEEPFIYISGGENNFCIEKNKKNVKIKFVISPYDF